jgi:small-conductance mechanosensitive channel
MITLRVSKPFGGDCCGWTRLLASLVLFFLFLTTTGWAQTPPPATDTAPGPPAQAKILNDLNLALQQQIKEFTEQLAQNQAEYKKSQEESHALGVAISTHKAALSLDKITLEQAKDLQQYYARLAEQKAKAAAALTQELEKYAKFQSDLREATQKSQGELAKPAKTPAKSAAQRALEQQNGQYLKLAGTAINKLEELQKVTQSHLEVLQQGQAFLEDFALTLQKFAEEKFKTQLLERQKPTDIFTLTKGLFTESLSLPQRFYDWASEKIQSGAALQLVKIHRSKLIGLLFFLGILLYAMKLLRRATQEFRLKLAAGAVTFSLKLIMALANALAFNYYLLAINIWLALSLWVMGVLFHPAAKILLGGLLALTIIRLLKHLLTALFAPGQPDQGIISLDEITARYYSRNGFLALLFFVGGYYFLWSLKLLGYQQSGYNFGVLIYLIIMNCWFLWLVRKPYLENLLTGAGLPAQSRLFRVMRGLRFLVLLGLSAIIIIDLLGFQNLALYLAGSTFLSALLVAAGWLVQQLGKDLNTFLTSPHGVVNVTLDVKAETLEGFQSFLSQTFKLVIIGLTVAGILLTWGVDVGVLQNIAVILSRGPSLGPLLLSPLALVFAGLCIWLARKISRFTRLVLETDVFRRRHWDIGIQHTISNIIHYALMTLGIIVALGFLGINFSNLAIIAGGLGVGIGFGLQNIVNNFFSGLILLFERPIKVGDLLVIDGQWGTVKAIRVRSTVFETVERSVLIIPNSDLISNKILNWTFKGRGPNRLTLKVGVAYDSNVHEVTKIIEQVCRQNQRVLAEPPPQVFFSAYGDSSLDFTVWVFVRTPADRNPAVHELNAAIFDALNRQGIEFPYPQMDVHLRSVPAHLQAKISETGD